MDNNNKKGAEILRIAGHNIDKSQSIVLFGTGKMGLLVIKALKRRHKKIICAIDNNPQKWGKRLDRTIKILSPEEGTKNSQDITYIIANVDHGEDMAWQLCKMGIDENQIIICDSSRKIEEDIGGGKSIDLKTSTFFLIHPKDVRLGTFLV